MCCTAKSRSGGSCRLNVKNIAERIARGRCEATGIPFRIGAFKDLNSNPYAPSLDRINAGSKYTTRGVKVVLWMINRARSDMSLPDFKLLLHEIQTASHQIEPK